MSAFLCNLPFMRNLEIILTSILLYDYIPKTL